MIAKIQTNTFAGFAFLLFLSTVMLIPDMFAQISTKSKATLTCYSMIKSNMPLKLLSKFETFRAKFTFFFNHVTFMFFLKMFIEILAVLETFMTSEALEIFFQFMHNVDMTNEEG